MTSNGAQAVNMIICIVNCAESVASIPSQHYVQQCRAIHLVNSIVYNKNAKQVLF